jgi:site-specific recombinase XerD
MGVVFGISAVVLNGFLEDLVGRGRGSYTIRSYRLGLIDFDRWLVERELTLASVMRRDIEDYIDGFAHGYCSSGRPPHAQRDELIELRSGRRRRPPGRAARTVNHRLSVLGSFFDFLSDHDVNGRPWHGGVSPVPRASEAGPRHGRPGGGDAPVRRRAELRRREPRKLPRDVDPAVVGRLIDAAGSWRDRSLLLLLSRTGARIGDWSAEHGRHGVLGMTLADFDRRTSTIMVRLKGARDEHRVPVTEQFWVAFDRYLAEERGDPATEAAWVGSRRGRGRPLSYAAFEAGLRHLAGKVGVKVSAHMFRHTVATGLVEHAGVALAQEVLGHRHVATTIDSYTHVDRAALVDAIAGFEQRTEANRTTGAAPQGRYVFAYDAGTLAELDAIAHPHPVEEHR